MLKYFIPRSSSNETMKISRSKLNPIYDQYSNKENRLTHALLHTIGSSNYILADFIKNFLGINPFYKSGVFEISTQKRPFGKGDDKPDKVDSIPDAWIINDKTNLGIAIEVKDEKNNIRLGQLKSHIKQIEHYDNPYLLVITPDIHKPIKIDALNEKQYPNLKCIWRSWDKTYLWLKKLHSKKVSEKGTDLFLISSMIEYLERRIEVLGFQGIPFNKKKPFNVEAAKPILKAEMDELHPYVKTQYKDLVKRRGGITTGSVNSVWDCFGSADGFTSDIHITVSIWEESHNLGIMVPNSSGKAWKRLKYIFSNDKSQNELISILAQLRSKVPYLYIEFHQRHYVNRQKAYTDGKLFFNIDAVGKPFQKKNSKTKQSPIWFQALQEAIINKKNLNGQIAFMVRFFFTETKGINSTKFLNEVKQTLKEMKPLYDYLKLEY